MWVRELKNAGDARIVYLLASDAAIEPRVLD
jgi:hypothetical protein